MDGVASSKGRAQVIGTGLIGGSVAFALRRASWNVTGTDLDSARAERALSLGALDAVGIDPDATITFIATPAGAVPREAGVALARGGVVTDVAGIKEPIVRAVDHPRFAGGHPMAGSEQEGIDGADPGLFEGATWVLTPTATTDDRTLALVRSVVTSFGANVVAIAPDRHDQLVALVSHVPHLTAATLMNLAADAADEDATLLRLAAGGFRDMTRIAAGHPGIWPDVCAENRAGIVDVLDRLMQSLQHVRDVVVEGDRGGLLRLLERAREARSNLPVGAPSPDRAVEVRIPVPDRPGVLSEVTTLLGRLAVNIFDLEIAHSAEGEAGVVVLVIDAQDVELAREALVARHYHPSFRTMAS